MIFINPDARSNRDVPNIGLAYVASILDVPVVDLNAMTSSPDRYLDRSTDVLGVSVQSRTVSEFDRITKSYQERYPETRVCSVMGIIDVQCCYPYLDVMDSVRCDQPFSDELPFPDYSLFDSYHAFVEQWERGDWYYSLMTSHGCPFGCRYCASRGRRWQSRSPENCVAELEFAKIVHSIRRFQILDDCFNVDPDRAIEFCKRVSRVKLPWRCANGLRADRFNEDVAAVMKESGCVHVNFGMESASPAVLETIQKGETLEDIERAIRVAQRFFDTVGGYFIIGLPGSSREIDLASLEWAKRMGIHGFFSFHVPFRGSLTQDALFYGDGARPMSDAYPLEEQEQIYQRSLDLERRSRRMARLVSRSHRWLRKAKVSGKKQ